MYATSRPLIHTYGKHHKEQDSGADCPYKVLILTGGTLEISFFFAALKNDKFPLYFGLSVAATVASRQESGAHVKASRGAGVKQGGWSLSI